MIALDAVRSAILSDSPFDRIDRLVRTELSAGRTVRAVFDDLTAIVDSALETPGLTPDGEEAFLGTLDALTGGCGCGSNYTDTVSLSPTTAADASAITVHTVTP